jgi:hypothetical protein
MLYMLKPPRSMLLGFIAGVMAIVGARDVTALVALSFARPLPMPRILDAVLGAFALVISVALLFGLPRALLLTRLYLAFMLLGEALLIAGSLVFG